MPPSHEPQPPRVFGTVDVAVEDLRTVLRAFYSQEKSQAEIEARNRLCDRITPKWLAEELLDVAVRPEADVDKKLHLIINALARHGITTHPSCLSTSLTSDQTHLSFSSSCETPE